MMEVKETKTISVAEVKEILIKRQKEGELQYEQVQALEHAEKVNPIKTAKIAGIVKELMKNEKITQEIATKIVDIQPKKPETLKSMLLRSRVELSDEETAEIIKILNK